VDYSLAVEVDELDTIRGPNDARPSRQRNGRDGSRLVLDSGRGNGKTEYSPVMNFVSEYMDNNPKASQSQVEAAWSTRQAIEDLRTQKLAQLQSGMIASLEQEISKPFEISALNEPIDPTDGMRVGPTAERAIQKFGQSGFAQENVASNQSAVETPLSSFLNYSGETIWKGELFGPQSLPGNTYGVIDTLKGFPSALAAARGAWTSSGTKNGYIFTSTMNGSLQVGRTQSSISVNRTPVPGQPAVQVSYGPTLTPTALARSAINSAAVKVLGPGLSFGGTVLEYGLYMRAGVQMQEAAHKANVRDFVTDATLDLQKGIVSGAAGASAGMYAGAAIGSFIPVPIVGTAVGALIGLGVGYLTSVGIENAYDYSGARDYWKGRR